ncbi:transporter [Aneurinibacillus migulanus]|uniref:chromate transporter n=1 Tax=Aneurinibacillus migulanus TaxID=47500 RepID=UPI0005B8ECCF|nr:chromate transporter [Aneurinibacillus migulanus]KIV57122.1 transporter [Aneurinibacillus migulanus]KPD07616.1 transporter [Aneurinibacillus migulanus]MED4729614.1 chromate transporter [Aneurinibacillus migulanus]CEH28803.1 Chromate transport protein [Aneurinibacillus migulanus]
MILINLWELFWGFFVANILGYGGGPASIPLTQEEIVNHYDWQTTEQFGDMLAVSNALPGPIATKIAAFIGYQEAGWLGVLVTTLATVAPSAIALIVLLKILNKYRNSPVVKGMTLLVQPVIAVMLLLLTYDMGFVSYENIGLLQSIGIAAIALLCITKLKLHPALVIVLAFAYGGLVLPHVMT